MAKFIHILFQPQELYKVSDQQSSQSFNKGLESSEESLVYIGENKKKILLLVEEHTKQCLSEANKEFLIKILGAVGLTFKDVALVNCTHYPDLSFDFYRDHFLPRRIIAFVNGAAVLGGLVSLDMYKIIREQDLEMVILDDLASIQADKSKKIQVWNTLKQLFEIVS